MVKIVEVGPRDGLQNETSPVPTDVKTSFVNALSAGVDKVAVFTGASESFTRRNIRATISGSLRGYAPVVSRARRQGLPVRGYISAAFSCPYDGKTDPQAVLDLVGRLFDLGVGEVSIADTVGRASPGDVGRLLDAVLPWHPAQRVAMHFHDTFGRAVANVRASWECGIRIFDSSAGGLGGCPFAPGATGNVATEAVVQALETAGETVGVDRGLLARARRLLDPYLEDDRRRRPPGADLPGCAGCAFATGEVCCGLGAARREGRDAVPGR